MNFQSSQDMETTSITNLLEPGPQPKLVGRVCGPVAKIMKTVVAAITVTIRITMFFMYFLKKNDLIYANKTLM